jgi:integrase
MSTLKAFVTAAWRDGIVDWKLEAKATTDKTTETRRATQRRDMRGPTPERLKKIREVIAADTSATGLRDLAIFALAESPMLRRSEIVALTIADIDLSEKTVRVFGKKRTESEKLNLVDDTIRDLLPWLALRKGGPTDPVFVRIRANRTGGVITDDRLTDSAIYFITRDRSFEAGFRTKSTFVRPHGLRHAGITNIANIIAREGIDVREGMAISRHKKEETFRAYVDRHGDSLQRRIMEKGTRLSRS